MFVKYLTYDDVKARDSIDYSETKPLVREESSFRLRVEKKQARFELKKPFATTEEARKSIEDYIRAWEFHVALERGPGEFRLELQESRITDRNPTPGVIQFGATEGVSLHEAVNLTVRPGEYPSPPEDMSLETRDPTTDTLYRRFMGYRSGHEPLASMAYFCLTVVEDSARAARNQKRCTRRLAAEKYGVEKGVLDGVGRLCSEKGGQAARKASGSGEAGEFTLQERSFLEQAVKDMIRAVARSAFVHGREG